MRTTATDLSNDRAFWTAELDRHTESPTQRGRCVCGGKAGACMLATRAREKLGMDADPETTKKRRPTRR